MAKRRARRAPAPRLNSAARAPRRVEPAAIRVAAAARVAARVAPGAVTPAARGVARAAPAAREVAPAAPAAPVGPLARAAAEVAAALATEGVVDPFRTCVSVLLMLVAVMASACSDPCESGTSRCEGK